MSDDDVHILSSAWKLWSSEASRKARSLAIRNLDSLLKQNDEEAIPQNVQKLEEINVGQRVRIPNIEYGSISLPDFPIVQYPKDSWSASDFDQGAECIYEVTNAIVHGEQGLIELDNYTLLESIRLVSFDGHSPFSRSEGSVFVPDRKSSISVHCAVHLCSGYPGGRNYAHWLVDIMPALAMCLYRKGLNDAILLIPEPRFEWQNEILNLLPELKSKSIYLSADSVVRADKLLLCSHLLKDPGHFPSQAVTLFSREIKRRLSVADIKPSRQIYVSRKDSFARRLLNEDDLISLLSKFGFEIITLSGLSFSEQVRVFSEASIIVAAHGAGLANAMFCSPGAKLLELFVDNYVQWSMRRLLSLMPIRYGCVVGKEVGFNIGQHGKVWEIGLAEVERAVVAMLIDK